jgi:hypothetical protein
VFDTSRKGKARLSEGSFFEGRGYVTIVRCNEERDRMCLTSHAAVTAVMASEVKFVQSWAL